VIEDRDRLRATNDSLRDRISSTQRLLEITQTELRVIREEYAFWKQQLACYPAFAPTGGPDDPHAVVDRRSLRRDTLPLSDAASSEALPDPPPIFNDLNEPQDNVDASVEAIAFPLVALPSGLAAESPDDVLVATDPTIMKSESQDSVRIEQISPPSTRTSRRASNLVCSYAEPKLNTKLRRGAAPGYRVLQQPSGPKKSAMSDLPDDSLIPLPGLSSPLGALPWNINKENPC
jgi:hypothetical protein